MMKHFLNRRRLLLRLPGSKKAASTILILDQFTGADTTLLSANAIAPTNTPGNAWVLINNHIKIYSNKCSSDGAGWDYCYTNCGVYNHTIECDVNIGKAATKNVTAIAFRGGTTFQNDLWFLWADPVNGFCIIQRQSSTNTVRAAGATAIAQQSDHTLKVTTLGDVITGWIDGGDEITYTSSFNNTKTKVGPYPEQSGTLTTRPSIDNFKVSVP